MFGCDERRDMNKATLETTYQVITPLGRFSVRWPLDEDEPPVYEGDANGIKFFRECMSINMITGDGGIRLDPDWLSPRELKGFCEMPDEGILVNADEPPDDDDEFFDAPGEDS